MSPGRTGPRAEQKMENSEATSVIPATYSFHDLFSIRVSHRGLGALMKSELGMFQREKEEAVDIEVEEGEVSALTRSLSYPWDEVDYSFDDSAFVIGTPSGNVQFMEGLLKAEPGVSPQLLLSAVTGLLRHRILEKGASLVHASAVSTNGVGYLFPAWAHSGKTNVILSFLRQGYDYMSDDWCFVSASGDVLAYPRYLSIFDYNIQCHPFLQETLRRHGGVANLGRRLAVIEFAQTLDRTHRLSKRVRGWLLAHFRIHEDVPASVAVPDCRTELRSKLSKACLLVTTDSDKYDISETSPDKLAPRVVSCGQFERDVFRRHQAAAAFSGFSELVDLVREETDLVEEALASARCVEIRLPRRYDRRVLDRIRERLEAL